MNVKQQKFYRGGAFMATLLGGLVLSAPTLASHGSEHDLTPPTNVRLSGDVTNGYTLHWTKPTQGSTAIEGFNLVFSTSSSPDPVARLVYNAYARLTLATANCTTGNACSYALHLDRAGAGGGVNIPNVGANYFGLRTVNRNGAGIGGVSATPHAYSALSALSTAAIRNTTLLTVTPSSRPHDRFHTPTWDAMNGTGSFQFQSAADGTRSVFFHTDRERLKNIPVAPTGADSEYYAGFAGHNLACPGAGGALPCSSTIPVTTGAGAYYVAYRTGGVNSAPPGSGADPVRAIPADAALGGLNNPIVFPGTPTNLSLSGTTLRWQQLANTYKGFSIYHASAAGVDSSSSAAEVAVAANGVACSGGVCTYDVANLGLATGQTYHFKVAARGSSPTVSGLSANEVNVLLPDPPLRLSNKSSLDGTTRTLEVGDTSVALELGDATGGRDGATKTYTLTRTSGAANLAALGLQIQQTGTGPITITNAPGGTVAGNITLTYEVSDNSDADTDSFSLSINVTAEPALNLDGDARQTVESGNEIEAIALSALNFDGDISYVLVEVVDGSATGSSGNPLHGLRVTPNDADDKRATVSGTPARTISFVVRATAGSQTDDSEPINISVTGGSTPSAAAAASGGGSGGAAAALVLAAGAYFWWKKRQIANGADPAKMALLPDVNFDLDRNDNRAFFTKMNWQNSGNSNWQLRGNASVHTKYSGKLLDWNANSHLGYRLNGKFGEFNPYLRGKFVQNAPENAKIEETYTVGVNYAIPNRFSVQFLQPDDEIWRYSIKTQVQLGRKFNLNFARPNSDLPNYSLGLRYQNPRGFSVSVTQPNSEIANYSLGIQWRGASRIRYEFSGNTSGRALRLHGSISF